MAEVTRGSYLICRSSGDQWAIHFEGRFLARFPEKSQAIQAAITVAHATRAEADASVLVQAPGGDRYPVWCSKVDSYVSAV